MNVISHATEGVKSMAKSFDAFLYEQIESITVRVFEEYRLSGVTTKNDVIDGAREMDAWFTCHGVRITENI